MLINCQLCTLFVVRSLPSVSPHTRSLLSLHQDADQLSLVHRSFSAPMLSAAVRVLRIVDAFTDVMVVRLMLEKVCS